MINNIRMLNVKKEYKRQIRRPGLMGSIKDVFKREYKVLEALKGIDMNIERGDIIGYIGKNGAGKSTTIKILLGIIKECSGELHLNGKLVKKHSKEFYYDIGAVFGQRNQLWWDISIENSFHLLKKIYKLSDKEFDRRIEEIDQFLDIKSLFPSALRVLSLGQKMKCEFAAAFLHSPSLILLDEAMLGIDLISKEAIRKLILHDNDKYNTTFLITSHELSEIEKLAKKIVVIDNGKIIHNDSLECFKETYASDKRKVVFSTAEKISKKQFLVWKYKYETLKLINDYKFSCVISKSEIGVLINDIQSVVGINDVVVNEEQLEEIVYKIYGGKKSDAVS